MFRGSPKLSSGIAPEIEKKMENIDCKLVQS